MSNDPTQHYTAGAVADTLIAGRYLLQQKIGEGGMGEVWVANQTEPVKRKVALKLIKAGMDSRAVLVRFEQERQALAMMDHPNIAKVFDAGVTPTGHPFFAMELVHGEPLNKFCDAARLSPKQRLELFIPICHAVQHAHQKGIIHRDLKPANILVTNVDGVATAKVIDFGVAKATSGKLTQETLNTSFGAVVGTLEYMAPEQAGTTLEDVDTRADIYSLGVILYELLTGLRPFDSQRLQQAALTEMIRVIREDEPSKPSTRLSSDASLPSLAALRQTEPKKLMAQLRGELDWVVMKCLEKSRERRYETANGLARDIQRYVANEPVEARPPSAIYRLQKFLDRNRGAVVAASLILLSMVAGMIGTSWGWFEARRQTVIAQTQATAAEDSRQVEVEQRHIAEVACAQEAEQRALAEQANQQAFDALDSFTSELMGNLLGSRAQLTESERAILKNAELQWEVFAKSKGNSAQSRLIQAEGAANLSAIQYKLGLRQAAEENDRKALLLRETLASEFPDIENYQRGLASALQSLGGTLRGNGQRAEAREKFRQAVQIYEALVAAQPESLRYLSHLANCSISLGNSARDFGEWPEARAAYLKSMSIEQTLIEKYPDELDSRAGLARCHWGLAFLSKRQELLTEAIEHYQQAIAIYEELANKQPDSLDQRQAICRLRGELALCFADHDDDAAGAEQLLKVLPIQTALVRDFPSVSNYRFDLAKTHRDLAMMLGQLKRIPEAEEQLSWSLDIWQRLIRDQPTVNLYPSELALTYRIMGDVRSSNRQADEALAAYAQAIEILTPLYVQDPQVALIRSSLCNCFEHRAQTLDQNGRHVEALQDWNKALPLCKPEKLTIYRSQRADSRFRSGAVAESIAEVIELAKVENPNPDHWIRFAKLFSLASEKMPARKAEFTAQALAMLSKSISLGFTNLSLLRDDDEFATLRDDEQFKQLLR